VLQEACKSSDIAGMFYRNGVQRTVAALEDWLRVQKKRGSIELDDVGLRRPTMDDVFLSLTGHTVVEADADEQSEAASTTEVTR